MIAFQRIWSIYKHFTFFCFHKSKIRQCRNNGHTASAGAENRCDLRDHSGCQCLLQVNGTKSFQSVCSLLESQTCTVNKTDYRCACFHCKVIQCGNFLCMHFSNGSVQNRSVLAVNIDKISVDHTRAGDHTV